MRFDALSPAHVRRAIDVYLARAYPPDGGKAAPVIKPAMVEATTTEEVLAAFEKEQRMGQSAPRYTYQLGNARYPYMKLVIEEYLVDGELFMIADTHDDLEVLPTMPHYEGWLELKRINRVFKADIERDWRAAGLPTLADLREICERLGAIEREEHKDRRILVVDDEEDAAHALAELLVGRGYDIELAFSGEQALERLARDPLPHLVLLDYGLPGLTGQQVIRRMRGDARLERVPVLMATAAPIALGQLGEVSGLLRKPYPRQVLFALLRGLFAARGS
jgi:CheY-like chemotaxis protein